jgi:DNA processing protein
MTNRNRIHIADWEIEREQSYAYWLMCAPIGDSAKSRLLLRFGRPSGVFEASEKALLDSNLSIGKKERWIAYIKERQEENVKREYEELQIKGILFYPEYHPHYPAKLLSIPARPFGIFVKGKLPDVRQRSLAIVGARDCSEYGQYVARHFAEKMAQNGVAVISGLARGIDGIAQRAAMEAGGESFGVLGSGADICYPKSNEKLYRMCMERGGILSTYLPGTPPTPNLFPPRNRIISGLSDGILIIEAREKSGTIITADLALEQGKDVFVIPGRVTDRLSDGCNSLIRQGASLIQSPEQLLEELHIGYGKVPVTGYEEEENPHEQGKESGKAGLVICGSGAERGKTGPNTDGGRSDGGKQDNGNSAQRVGDNADNCMGQSDNRETFSQFTLEEQAFLQLFDLELLSIEQIRRKMVVNSFLKNITLPQTMEMLMKFVIMGQLRAEGGYYAKMMSGIGDKK